MRRGTIIGGLAAVAVAAAATVYFALVPGVLASRYRDDARPEHRRLQVAMERLYASFVPATFGEQQRAVDSMKDLRREIRLERRAVRRARAAVRSAEAALSAADEGKLTDVPSWPAIDLTDAEHVAALERDYVRDARAFVRSYRRLIDYSLATRNDYARAVTIMADAAHAIPEHPSTPEQIARPMDTVGSRLDGAARRLRARRPPPAMREQYRLDVGAFAFFGREFHRLADYFRARDVARIKAFDHELTSGAKRYTGGGHARLRRLIVRSTYAHAIRRLRRLELRIQHGYDTL